MSAYYLLSFSCGFHSSLFVKKEWGALMDIDSFTKRVIGCAIEVHKTLGPGLLESSDERCLMYELKHINISA